MVTHSVCLSVFVRRTQLNIRVSYDIRVGFQEDRQIERERQRKAEREVERRREKERGRERERERQKLISPGPGGPTGTGTGGLASFTSISIYKLSGK